MGLFRGTLHGLNGTIFLFSLATVFAPQIAHAQVPSKPTGLTATAGDGLVVLAWDNPRDSSIIRWEYQRKEARTDIFPGTDYGDPIVIDKSGESGFRHTVRVSSGLENGRTYAFKVRAVNDAGNGVVSNEVEATPVVGEISLSASKMRIEEGDSGKTSITLTVMLSRLPPPPKPSFAILRSQDGYPVAIQVGSSTASRDEDYRFKLQADLLYIPEGKKKATFTVDILGDTKAESDETIVLEALGAEGIVTAWTQGEITITIGNDDASPELAALADVTLKLGQAVDITASATDADGDTVSYVWTRKTGETSPAIPQGTALDQAQLTFRPPAVGTYTMTVTASDGNGNSDTEEVTITVGAATLVSVPAVLSVTEGTDANAVVTITAEEAFGEAVTFNVTYGSTSAATDVDATGATDPASGDYDNDAVTSVEFAAGDTSKNITIPITDDDLDEEAETFTVTVAPASGSLPAGFVLGQASTTVTIADDDVVGVTVSETALTITEGDATGDDYTVKLNTRPTAAVTITVSGHSGSDVVPSPTALTFTTGNWNEAQTVTVTARDDPDATADAVVPLAHAATGGDYGGSLTIGSVRVTVTEDDVVGVTVSETALTITEGDATGDDYTVKLNTRPTAAVTITVSGHSGSDVVPSPTALTFTTGNWNEAQTVTVTARDDPDATADAVVPLAHAATGGDYGGSLTIGSVRVTVTEDDVVGVTVSETALTITEGDATGDDYTVKLNTRPTAAVTITVSGHSGSDVVPSPTALTFTTGNWNEAQTVTVTARDDPDATADAVVPLAHAATGGDYGGSLTIGSVRVTVTEDDVVGVTVSETALTITEGDATGDDYTVKLNTRPTAAVTITVSGHSGSDVVPSPTALTFTTGNWNEAQTVTVTARDDPDATADAVVPLAHAATGGDYGGSLTIGSVRVTVTEDDVVGVTVSETALTITEGDATGDDYTVKLNTRPTAAVTITVSGHSGSDVVPSPTALTFTTGNWNEAQTVTVTARDDPDATADAVVPLAHAATGGDYGGSLTIGSVRVTVTEDDVVGVTVSETALTITEGDATGDDYTVKLNTRPTAAVTITVSGHSGSDVVPSPTALTFTTGNWNEAQTVTVTARDDPDATADAVVPLAHAATGGDYGGSLTIGSVRVTVTEDDVVGVTVSETALTITEGDATGDDYTVKLNTRPTAAVTITVSGHSGSDVVPSPTALTFTTGNWNEAQTVTVTARDDPDATADAVVPLAHAATGGDYGGSLTIGSVRVTVTEDDVVGVTVSETALTITEGDATGDDYTVKLNTRPTAAVTITVSGHSGSDVVPSPTALTFTTGNWNEAQTVTVTARDDPDATADAVVPLAHAATGGDYGGSLTIGSVRVTVTEDDVVGVTVSETALTITEGDATGDDYTVKLNTRPTAAVTITVSGHSGSDVVPSPTALTFTTGNWNEAQTVTVTARDDPDATADAVVPLAHAATGGDYGGSLTIGSVRVTVTEDDVVGVTVSETALTITEGDATGDDYTVKLNTRPTAAVTITVSGHSGSDVVPSPTALTFTTGNWNEAQTVTVTARDDPDATADAVVPLAHAATGGDYGGSLTIGSVRVTVTEDDVVGVTVSETALTITEGDATGDDYTVKLNTRPTAAVTITVSGHSGSDVVPSPTALTFTTGNWNEAQTVTVTARDDPDATADAVVPLAHAATGGDYGGSLTIGSVRVTVTEDDVVGVTVSETALTITEGDATGDDYTVKLNTRPTAAVTITVSGHSGSDVVPSPTALTFTTGNWNEAQTVTVTARDDPDATADAVVPLAHAATGGDYGGSLTIGSVRVTVTEDDVVGVTVSETALTITEGDATGDDYTVKLNTRPTAAVTITVSGHSGSDVVPSPTALTFTTGNWNEAQTVTVTARDDPDATADAVVPLAHAATGGDYGGSLTIGSVRVTVTEDDVVGVTVSETALTITEGDATGDDYTVKLNTRPTAAVTITVSGHSGSDVVPSPTALTFTTGNWNEAQTVTVTARDDPDATADAVVPLAHAATGGDYGGSLTIGSVRVTVTEDDVVGVTVSETALTITEGDATGDDYTVKLNTRPTAAVTITVSGHSGSDVVPSPTALTFTTGNWNEAQTVTVTARDDPDATADAVVPLAHAATGGDYGGSLTIGSVRVTVTEDDVVGVTVSETALTITEGDATGDDYTVKLNTRPTAAVTITVSGHSGSDVVPSPTALTFTTGNWNEAQTVTVTARDDPDATADAVVPLAHAATGGDYGGSLTIGSVRVTVTEDDVVGVTVSETALTITEGDATGDDYTVKLNTRPTAAVTITVSGHSGSDVVPSPTALTFTTGNWNEAQTVTVTARDDPDATADAVVPLAHAATGGDYGGSLTIGSVRVTVTEDDVVGVTVSETALTITEGDATGDDYTVKLNTRPTAAVTITVSGHSGSDVVPSPTALTFTTGNWNEAQTVTVTARDDPDATADAVVPLAHAATGGDYGGSLTIGSVRVTVTEDDVVGVTVSETALTITEGDATGDDYTVKLNTRPTAAVTITVSGHSGSDVVPSPTALTFTTGNWNEAQTVTVTARDDPDATADAVVPLAHAATGGDYGGSLTIGSVRVTVTEDDVVGVTVSETALTITEGDATGDDYTVKLNTRPTAAVTITVSGHSGSDVVPSPTALTFTTGNWNEAQTVTVTARDDPDATADAVVPLAHAATGGDYGGSLTIGSVRVTVTEDDVVGVTVSETALTITEGDATGDDYTVKLNTRPTAAVTITVSGHSGSDVVPSPTALTFTTGNWNEAQTVTVTARDDPDATADAVVPLAHAATGGDYGGSLTIGSVRVTVTEDDVVGVTVSETALTITEGDATGDDYTVKLNTRPTAAVTITVSGHSGSDVVPSPTALTFTTGNWNEAQTVTVTARDDPDATADAVVPLAHAATGGDYGGSLTIGSVRVTVTEDDVVGVTVSETALTITEGDATGDDYTVKLNTRPTAAVTITVSGHSGSDVVPSPTALTFTTGNWNEAQTVTVTARDDPDATADAVVPLAHAATGGDYGGSLTIGSVRVTVTEDDVVGVTVSETALTITEGDATGDDYTVKLNTRPTAAVTITVSGHSGSDVVPSPTALTFTTGNWNEAQTVTVTARDDPDATADAVVPLAHAATGGDYGGSLTIGSVRVTVTEDDVVGVTVSETALTITEGDATGDDYTVKLNTRPTAAVTITVSGHSGSDVVPSPTALTFTTGNWNEAQTVTVTARDDPDATADAVVPLAHAATGGDYGGSLTIGSVRVTVTEDDVVGVTVSETALTITEGDATGDDYTVKLNTRPTAAVTITVSGHSGSDVVPSPTALTFTTGNWNEAQTVTVTARDDPDATADAVVPLAHAATGGDYGGSLTIGSVRVTVTEDDVVGVTVSETALTITEGDATGDDYTVKLNTRPTAAVTITVSGHSGSDVVPSPTALTFTTGNWNEAQTVTVTARDDPDATADAVVPLAHAATGGDYGGSLTIGSVRVTVTEDDVVGVTVSETALTITEGDATGDDYTVKLNTRPTAAVTITVSGHSGSDVVPSPTALTFTTGNWNEAQTVTVTARDDPDATADAVVPLAHAATGGDYGGSLTIGSVRVTVTEDDVVGVTVSETALTITEGDATGDDYTVKLNTRPTAAVTITVSGHSGSDVVPSPTALTFTTGNWNEAQTVTVTARDDPDATADAVVPLAHAATGGDYGGSLTIGSVRVTVTEDDTESLPILQLLTDPATVIEGEAIRLTVTSDRALTGMLTVSLTLADRDSSGFTGEDLPDGLGPRSFAAAFGATASRTGTVDIETNADMDEEGAETYTITLNDAEGYAVGSDATADGVLNDSTPILQLLTDPVAVTEGETIRLTVTSDRALTGMLSVSLTLSDRGSGGFTAEDVQGGLGPRSFEVAFGTAASLTGTVMIETGVDPDEEGVETYTITLNDAAGYAVGSDATADGVLNDGVSGAAARANRIHEKVLPQVAAVVQSQSLGVITDRIEMAASGAAPDGLSLNALPVASTSDGRSSPRLREILDGAGFALPLSAAEGGKTPVSIWGRGGWTDLDGSEDGVDWDGDVWSAHVGADLWLRPDLLAGAAVSYSESDIDARTDEIESVYETRLTAVHPYVAWLSGDGSNLWASVGYGQGEVRIEEENAAARTTDLSLASAAVGGRHVLVTDAEWLGDGVTRLSVKGEGSLVRARTDAGDGLARLSVNTGRARLALEGSHERALEGGGTLIPALEVGARYDGGDAAEGAGLETGASLTYRDPTSRLTAGLRARALVAHERDRDEWGVSGMLALAPEPDGRGTSLTLGFSRGGTESGIDRLFDRAPGSGFGESGDGPSGYRLEAEIGQGFAVPGRGPVALVSPYVGLTLEGADSRTARLGARYRLTEALSLSFEARHDFDGASGETDGIMLHCSLRW